MKIDNSKNHTTIWGQVEQLKWEEPETEWVEPEWKFFEELKVPAKAENSQISNSKEKWGW